MLADQLPEAWHTRVALPDSVYPVLHWAVAVDLNVVDVDLKMPSWRVGRDPQSERRMHGPTCTDIVICMSSLCVYCCTLGINA